MQPSRDISYRARCGRFFISALLMLMLLANEPGNALGIGTSEEHVGFAAQAVGRVIPEAVSRGGARLSAHQQ